MIDQDAEARFGLARGLRETFFDGLEGPVLDWYTKEGEQEVSHHLLDHLVRQSRHCRSYKSMVLDVYKKRGLVHSFGHVWRQKRQGRPFMRS